MGNQPHALDLKIPPAVLAVIFGLAMWLVSRATPVLEIALIYRILLGSAPTAAGFILALSGIVTFRRVGTTIHPTSPQNASSLVTAGVYRFTRNPMYLGILLALLGWGLFLGRLPSLFVLPLFVAYLTRFQILPEEKAMETLFGSEFSAYKARVRRWI